MISPWYLLTYLNSQVRWRELHKPKPSHADATNGFVRQSERINTVTTPTSSSECTPDLGDGDGDDIPAPIKTRIASRLTRTNRDRDEEEEGIRGPEGLRLLRYSSEPLIDLIFVHGLRGGSVKTWRRGSDPRSFWPQFWLPMEPGFENVNIYSFGYDSDWASLKSSILNVHDFGQGLLEEMRDTPYFRGNKVEILQPYCQENDDLPRISDP